MKPLNEPDYDAIYRRLNPKVFPYSPWERQRELRDLWPSDRERFKQMVRDVLSPTPPGGSDE